MNTNTETKTITAEDVRTFLCQQAVSLSKRLKEDYVFVNVEVRKDGETTWGTYSATGTHKSGATLEEAVAAQIEESGPKKQAKRLREQAAEILKQAEQLETETTS